MGDKASKPFALFRIVTELNTQACLTASGPSNQASDRDRWIRSQPAFEVGLCGFSPHKRNGAYKWVEQVENFFWFALLAMPGNQREVRLTDVDGNAIAVRLDDDVVVAVNV